MESPRLGLPSDRNNQLGDTDRAILNFNPDSQNNGARAARSTGAGGDSSMPKPLTEDDSRAFATLEKMIQEAARPVKKKISSKRALSTVQDILSHTSVRRFDKPYLGELFWAPIAQGWDTSRERLDSVGTQPPTHQGKLYLLKPNLSKRLFGKRRRLLNPKRIPIAHI